MMGSAIGAPMFYVLSGVGTALLCSRTRRSARELDAALVRRGLVLYGFGMLVNLLTPSWFSWGSFFALHMMGVGIMLAPLWRRMSSGALLGVVELVLAATPLVQAWVDTPAELTNPEMCDLSQPGGALRLAVYKDPRHDVVRRMLALHDDPAALLELLTGSVDTTALVWDIGGK